MSTRSANLAGSAFAIAALLLASFVPAYAQINIDSHTSINGPGGAIGSSNFGPYDASGAEKLVVLVGGGRDRGSPLGINSVTYAGTPLDLAVKVSSTTTSPQGVAAGVYYLDSPGAGGDLVVNWSAKSWGIRNAITVLEISGALPGHGPVDSSPASASASVTTTAAGSLVLAVSKAVSDAATEVPHAPLTDLLAGTRIGSGYQFVASPSTVTPTFSLGDATAAAAFEPAVVPAGPQITSITAIGGGVWELMLEGDPSTGYEFRSSPILDFSPGALVENLAAGGVPVGTIGGTNDSVLTTDGSGNGTARMTLSGSPADFVRAQTAPPAPPVEIFSQNFDGAAGPGLPTDWTSGTNPADNSSLTSWEVGTPANVGPIPPGVPLPSGSNCVATNIMGNYDDPVTDLGVAHTDIWLRSPAIDLGAATAGTLTFQQWTQIEDVAGDLDYGSIRILDADDDSELAVMEPQSIDGSTSGWEEYSMALPAAAFTATAGTIKVEFRFEADDIDSLAGWYIDDVTVTVPGS